MNNLTGMSDVLISQINNPDCSYLTGMMMGGGKTSTVVLSFLLMLLAFRFVDKLAIGPLLSWCKDKIYNRGKK